MLLPYIGIAISIILPIIGYAFSQGKLTQRIASQKEIYDNEFISQKKIYDSEFNQLKEIAENRRIELIEIKTNCKIHSEKIGKLENDNSQIFIQLKHFGETLEDMKKAMQDMSKSMIQLSKDFGEHIAYHKGKEEK